MDFEIDIYTRNGELVEVHYLEEKRAFYILLHEKEPMVFKKATKRMKEIRFEKELLERILAEAEKKFKDIRLFVMLHPEKQPKPPVLTFFETYVK